MVLPDLDGASCQVVPKSECHCRGVLQSSLSSKIHSKLPVHKVEHSVQLGNQFDLCGRCYHDGNLGSQKGRGDNQNQVRSGQNTQ